MEEEYQSIRAPGLFAETVRVSAPQLDAETVTGTAGNGLIRAMAGVRVIETQPLELSLDSA